MHNKAEEKGKIIIKAINESQSIICLLAQAKKMNFSVRIVGTENMVHYRICRDINENSNKYWIYYIHTNDDGKVDVKFLGKVVFVDKRYVYSNLKAQETRLSRANMVISEFFKDLFNVTNAGTKQFLIFEREHVGNFYLRNTEKLDAIKQNFADSLVKYEDIGEVIENTNTKQRKYKFYEKKDFLMICG